MNGCGLLSPLRLGFLYPGYAAEDEYSMLAGMLSRPVTAELVHTGLGPDGDAHTIEALRDMGEGERLAAGAESLRIRKVAAVVWACTSGSFVYGWDGAHAQAAAIGQRLGVPASSTSLGFVHAARVLGVRRVAVAATYPADVAERFVRFLTAAGIEVSDLSAAGIMTATEAGEVGVEAVVGLVSAADRPDADAVLVPDTALHTVAALPGLEAMLGKPVLTANQVSVWEALRSIGITDVRADAGRLFNGADVPHARSVNEES
jgi:maleate cis-trans isomerase